MVLNRHIMLLIKLDHFFFKSCRKPLFTVLWNLRVKTTQFLRHFKWYNSLKSSIWFKSVQNHRDGIVHVLNNISSISTSPYTISAYDKRACFYHHSVHKTGQESLVYFPGGIFTIPQMCVNCGFYNREIGPFFLIISDTTWHLCLFKMKLIHRNSAQTKKPQHTRLISVCLYLHYILLHINKAVKNWNEISV